MALCSLTTRKLDVPGEEGQWVEIRPLSTRVMRDVEAGARETAGEDAVAYGYAVADGLLVAGVVAWSYDAPVNTENVADLDMATAMWLVEQIVPGEAGVPLVTSSPSTIALTE